MKKLFTIILVVLIAIPAFSQIKFGIKAGVTSSTVPTYNVSSGTSNIEAVKDAAFGFHAGAFIRMTVIGIYLMPEVVFSSTTYDYNVTTVSGTSPVSQRYDKLEVPILLGLKLGPIRINAGPSATMIINSPKALINDPNFKDMYRNATFGYQAGVGFDLFKTFAFDARLGGSLAKRFGDDVSIGSQTFSLDSREPTFMLSFGFMF